MGNVETKVVTSSTELQEVFHWAQQTNTPVSLYRDKLVRKGVVLDLSNWNKIEQFDVDNLMVIVPPGLLLKDLSAIVKEQGMRFIPADTPAFANLSIGEWAYRGCPNLSAWKYGAGKHFLLGSSYVFPNGDMTPVGGKCIKNVTGYDFTRFLTGPYADLAVGVQYIIKLMPQPAFRITYDVEVTSLEDVIKLVGILQDHPVPPAWLFWLDKTVSNKLLGRQAGAGHRVLFELDGNEAEVREYAQFVNGILPLCKATLVSADTLLPDLACLEEEAKEFWLLDEFKVPYTQVANFAAKVERLLSTAGCTGGLFGQLADGKIHLYLEQGCTEVANLVLAIQAVARELGGAVTGKYQRLYQGGSTGKLAELEKTFKQQLDPAGIFNSAGEVTP